MLTFDDGFKNNMFEAAPILRKYEMTALEFLITSQLTKRHSRYRAGTVQYASLKDLEANCDVFDYQSHTYNYHMREQNGTAFLKSKAPELVQHDIATSFHNLNKAVRHFAYPYGEYDGQMLNVQLAFTVTDGMATKESDPLQLPRISIFPHDTLATFQQKLEKRY